MHAGISTVRQSFEALLKERSEKAEIYVLEEGGRSISEMRFGEPLVFVLGDHVGLPKKVEGFALRYGQKVSLGRQKYLAASCITILNYHLDRQAVI